jgi:hypothetical protein
MTQDKLGEVQKSNCSVSTRVELLPRPFFCSILPRPSPNEKSSFRGFFFLTPGVVDAVFFFVPDGVEVKSENGGQDAKECDASSDLGAFRTSENRHALVRVAVRGRVVLLMIASFFGHDEV